MHTNLHRKAVLVAAGLVILAMAAACGGPAASPQPTATGVPAAIEPSPTPFPIPPTATVPEPALTPTPEATQTEPAPGPAGALTVEEHAVVQQGVDEPTHFEYMDRISAEVLAVHQAVRQPSFAQKAESANAVLAPFGYRLDFKPDDGTKPDRFDLYKNEELVLADITSMHAPQVSADGQTLAMLVDTMTGPTYLVTPEGGQIWDVSQHGFIDPVFVGNDLASILSVENMINFEVKIGDETVYKAGPYAPGPENPIKALSSWEGHWVLETEGEVIVDGQSLNEQMGYDQVFAFHVIRGQPFYFFGKQGRVGVSYAGQILPQEYEQVIHYQCCEAGAFNVQTNEDMVWFHALRAGTWYYVEMGAY